MTIPTQENKVKIKHWPNFSLTFSCEILRLKIVFPPKVTAYTKIRRGIKINHIVEIHDYLLQMLKICFNLATAGKYARHWYKFLCSVPKELHCSAEESS